LLQKIEFKDMKKKIIWIAVLIIIVLIFSVFITKPKTTDGVVKIGIITDLSGPAAYWGEKTLVGAEMVKQEFAKKGINIEIIAEDYQFEAGKAATAAQKLTSIDKVDLLYAEFNPAAISAASVIKDLETPFVYVAAIESPLEQVSGSIKTYLDYRQGCKDLAERFKSRGIEKVGLLKVSLEFGELCSKGVEEVYGGDLIVEGYTIGDTDFRTQVAKLKLAKAGAILNVGFEGDTYNTLKNMREIGLNVPFGTVSDTMSEKVLNDFKLNLKGSLAFGFDEISEEFKKKVRDFSSDTDLVVGPEFLPTALAYMHLTQSVKSLLECKGDKICFADEMNSTTEPDLVGFTGFKNRIANYDLKIFEY
jgi:ABC-type branched-subunit amino acid transport system substrate-binding protein